MRLFDFRASVRPTRIVTRRLSDGQPLLRLHYRQPLFNQTVGIFDAGDRRVGYFRGDFKRALHDEFTVLGTDSRTLGQVRRSAAGTYNFAAGDEARVGGTIAITRNGARGDSVACAQVSYHDPASGEQPTAAFMLATALVLIQ
jgi:hypothetical protein